LAAKFASIDAWSSRHGESSGRSTSATCSITSCAPTPYHGSYQGVLRYVRARFGRPRIRTYRRVETVPGSQCQSDWGVFPALGR
jgi:hypothetical protein